MARRFGGNDAAHAALQVFKNPGLGKRELDLIAVQHLENHHFMTLKPKLLESERDVFGRFEQVGEEQNHAPPMHQPSGML